MSGRDWFTLGANVFFFGAVVIVVVALFFVFMVVWTAIS